MEKEVTLLAILQELRDFRKENNTRLEVLENRLDRLEGREIKLDERMSRMESKMETLEDKMLDLEKRTVIIENKREKERKELFNVLDNMQRKLMDIIEQKSQEIKENLEDLEDWKEDFDSGMFTPAY